MSDPHDHSAHEHAPETQDAGAQALSEALHSSFVIVKVVMVLLVLLFFSSGIFTVGQQERAVILRFGRPVGIGENRLLAPGLHWSFPYPIDEVVKIPVIAQQVVRSTIGWYHVTPEQELSGQEPPAGPINLAQDGYLITADQNILHLRATLRYRVQDPFRYIFNFVSSSNLVENAVNNALLYCAGRFKVDDILLYRQNEFQEAVQNRTEQLVEQEDLGIVVEQCTVDRRPPRQLQPVFDQVTTTRENRNKALIDANSYTNQILNQAEAEAATIIQQASLVSGNYVTNVMSEAKRFNDLLPLYESDPHLFTQQYVVQTMDQVLTNVEKWLEPTSDSGRPTELRLQLNREPLPQKGGAGP
jgi:membrane protease subunit HflK